MTVFFAFEAGRGRSTGTAPPKGTAARPVSDAFHVDLIRAYGGLARIREDNELASDMLGREVAPHELDHRRSDDAAVCEDGDMPASFDGEYLDLRDAPLVRSRVHLEGYEPHDTIKAELTVAGGYNKKIHG